MVVYSPQKEAAAIIVAAGNGVRAGGSVAKQWRSLAGQRVLDHTVDAFLDHPRIHDIVLVLRAEDLDYAPPGVHCVPGGFDRASSVKAGLDRLRIDAPRKVLIHDGARPCVGPDLIDNVLNALDTADGAAPAIAVTDALWTGNAGRVTGARNRAGLYRAQTPQGFDYAAILHAHEAHPGGASDDVEVAREAGIEVAIVEGDEDNLKITLPSDFERAERIMRERNGHSARKRI